MVGASAGVQLDDRTTPSLAAAHFVLRLSPLTPRLSLKRTTAMQVLICREPLTDQSQKSRLTVEALSLSSHSPLPASSESQSVVSTPPPTRPIFLYILI